MASGDNEYIEDNVIGALLLAAPPRPAQPASGRMPPPPRLSSSAEIERAIELREGQTLRVGRAENNDLALRDKQVSRYHALFTVSSCGIVLCDLSSLNGTYVNGARISSPVDLASGDRVRIGETEIIVRLGPTSESPQDSLHANTPAGTIQQRDRHRSSGRYLRVYEAIAGPSRAGRSPDA